MKKKILFLLIFMNFSMYSQKNCNDTIYIILSNEKNQNQFVFKKDKKNKHANIKVFNYVNNNQIINKNKSGIIKVNPQPHINNHYDYYSIDSPKRILSIKNLKTLTIEDLSKNQYKIVNTQIIIFIEKLNNSTYNLWPMKLSYQE